MAGGVLGFAVNVIELTPSKQKSGLFLVTVGVLGIGLITRVSGAAGPSQPFTPLVWVA